MGKIIFILLIIFATGFIIPVSSANAAATKNRSADCKPADFGKGKVWSLSMRIATCSRAMLLTVVDNAYDILEKPAQAVLAGVLLLSITLFGVKLFSGMIQQQNVMGEMVLFGIKAGFATFIIANYESFYEIPFHLLDALIEVSTGWINIEFSTEINETCIEYLGDSSVYDDEPMLKTWWNYDCIGIISLGYHTKELISSATASPLALSGAIISLTVLIEVMVFFPVFGFLLLFAVIAFLFTIFATIFKGIIVYVRTIIILSLIVIIFPFLLPFMFFSYTKTYYDSLLEIILETLFQPVIFFTIIGMFMMILIGSSANENSPLDRYKQSLKITQNVGFAPDKSGDEDQAGSITVVVLQNTKAEDKYSLVASILGTLIISAAMVAFAQNSEQIANTMFSTPTGGVGGWSDAPKLARGAAAWAGGKASGYTKKLSSSERGKHNTQAFDNLKAKTKQRIDSINANKSLSDYEKGSARKATYSDAKEQKRTMERENRHTGPRGTFKSEVREWMKKDDTDIKQQLQKSLAKLEKAPISDKQKEETRNNLNKRATDEINERNTKLQESIMNGTYKSSDTTFGEKRAAFRKRVFNGAKSDLGGS